MHSAGESFVSEELQLALTGAAVRYNWGVFSFLLALNHASFSTSLVLATSILPDAIAYTGLALYYTSYCFASLFVAVPVGVSLGTRAATTFGMLLNSLYMAALALAMILPQLAWLFVVGAILGGIGSSFLGPALGKYLSFSSQALAAAQGLEREAASTQLVTMFAFLMLTLEVMFKVGVSAGGPNALPRIICSGFALLSAVLMRLLVYDTRGDQQEATLSASTVLAVVQLWREPRLWCLSPTNFAFGFSAAFMNGYVNAKYTKVELGNAYVGYFAALTVLVAAGASLVPSALTRSGWEAAVRGSAVVVGALCFVSAAALALFAGIDDWGDSLVILYVLLGFGRAMYETTNKALFADFFPGQQSPSAFANLTLQNSLAFTFCFFLSPIISGAALASIALVFSALIVPMYALAVRLGPLRQS